MENGIIIKSLSGFYDVETAEGTVRCEARGRFRHLGIKPVVGDMVALEATEPGCGVINAVLPRKNVFARPAVANVDQIVFVVSEVLPVTDTTVLDRMIAMAEKAGVEPVICVNKCDVADGERLRDIYTRAGFTVYAVSAATGDGVEALKRCLAGRISAFAGDTGVGKSSLLNRLLTDAALKTGAVSEKLGRGRHTTRHVELYHIDGGGLAADTPGFASFDEESFQPEAEEVERLFREFAPYLGACRFVGCAHTKEQGCAVLAAVEAGAIPASRHKSYVQLYQEAKSRNSWEKKNRKKV